MGNDEAFRKIRDKLAGFESDLRDDSWHLFEKHRLRKERGRKLAGALGIGMLVIFILGALVGSRVFLVPRNRVAQQSKRAEAAVQKHGATVETGKAGKPADPGPQAADYQEDVNKEGVAGVSATFPVRASAKLPGTIPEIPRSRHSYSGSEVASVTSMPDLPQPLDALVSRGLSLYVVNLGLPSIQISEMNSRGDTGRIGHGIQLSIGPVMRANYAKPSENRLILGPAVFGTVPITPKFALRAGLALMREHVYVHNTNPEFTKNAVRWLNRGDYRWWEVEIPVDIQIKLYDNPKYSLFGLFGASSSLYWGEHFKELYQKDKIVTTTLALHNGEVREVQGLVSKQEEPLTGESNRVVFAPATYFSASVILEKKLTTRSSVAIEPQLRYPIAGVTSRNLKFTSIGLQIRILYK
jgi:hypothetical protein